MEKIYGYKEKDVLGLAEFIKSKGNASLSDTFEKYGAISGKAKGTVRNLYYALAKHSNFNQDFCEKYLDGKPLKVSKIVEFDKNEEKDLVEKILIAKSQGKSCRSEILRLSGGDGKQALRYQNKYRNAVKNNPQLIEQVVKELKERGINFSVNDNKKQNFIPESFALRLKSDINSLIAKAVLKTKRENDCLKERIAFLEQENLKLCNLLYGTANNHAISFFRGGNGENVLH